MSTQNGQNCCPHCKKGSPAEDATSTPKISQMLSPAQIKLLEYANHLDGPDRVKHLKLLHNVALYHSHSIIDEDEKNALFSAKCLWECIEEIVGEDRR
ncbi:MAG: hypothetical protein ABJN84_03585 [Flavobacteriaceae bacterium]